MIIFLFSYRQEYLKCYNLVALPKTKGGSAYPRYGRKSDVDAVEDELRQNWQQQEQQRSIDKYRMQEIPVDNHSFDISRICDKQCCETESDIEMSLESFQDSLRMFESYLSDCLPVKDDTSSFDISGTGNRLETPVKHHNSKV